MRNFDFVFLLFVQCKSLQIVNIPSKAMQYKKINLLSTHKHLPTAAQDIAQLRRNFEAIVKKAFSIGSK